MELIPIGTTLEENEEFLNHSECLDSLYLSVEFYQRVGYHPPWIGYYAKEGDQLVGTAAFKGQPRDGTVEIAYSTFPRFRSQGVGTDLCRLLVELSLRTDPSVQITARTLPETNHSTRILEKNGFELLGTVEDEEDGTVWEWKYMGKRL